MPGIVGILECSVNRNSREKYNPIYRMAEDRILHIVNPDRDAR